MIIKTLEIISFGKFKDKTINLDNGLNVILGDNESGKSTIMSFIYAMLYGFGDNRGKSASLREKYTPWDGGVCEGKLTMHLSSGEDITIYRKAGTVKKQDTLRVYNTLTGQELSSIPEEIIGIGSDTFSKTLCLKQLSTAFCGTNEEIVQKLSNISVGGDENLSFEKAIKSLENARREIKPLRGTGGTLAQINTQIAELEKNSSLRKSLVLELDNALSLLPTAESNTENAYKKLHEALKEDYVSPVAHLRGRIEEKELNIKNKPAKNSIQKNPLLIFSAICAILALLCFIFSPLFSIIPVIICAICAILALTSKEDAKDNSEEELTELLKELSALEKSKAEHEEKISFLKKNTQEYEKNLSTLKIRVESLQFQLSSSKSGNLSLLYEQKALLEKRLSALTLAINSLNTAHEKMQRNFTPQLNKRASEYFSAITSEKYKGLFSDEQFNLSIDMDIPRKSELFSGGTVDQLYLSLRLALIDMLFGKETTFLLLDQPFLQYDDIRLRKAVELLDSLSKKRQIILFTSDKTAFSSNKHTEMLT